MRPFQANLSVANSSYVAAAQTLSASGYLTLSNTDYTYIGQTYVHLNDRTIARPGTLASTGNLSGVDFTFYGLDVYDQAISETISGPNNTSISTTSQFLTVTGIFASAAVSTNVRAGRAAGGTTKWYVPNWHLTPFDVSVAVYVNTNTCVYSIQHTFDQLFTIASFSSVNVFNNDDPALVNTSSSGDGNYLAPVGGIRCSFSTASTTATSTATFYLYQAGII